VEKVCKQVAIVCIVPERGLFDLENTVQVEEAEEADIHGCRHSVILYFCALGGHCKQVSRKQRRKPGKSVDKDFRLTHTETKMQLSVNSSSQEALPATLVDLRRGDAAILDRIDLPGEDAQRLMELGFLPGTRVTAGLSAPGGDPRVFQVDGSEIALRRETAKRLQVKLDRPKKH
jgi:Fe2+ transport system protein FeoA